MERHSFCNPPFLAILISHICLGCVWQHLCCAGDGKYMSPSPQSVAEDITPFKAWCPLSRAPQKQNQINFLVQTNLISMHIQQMHWMH